MRPETREPTDEEVAQQELRRYECLVHHAQNCHECMDWICCDNTNEARPDWAKDCNLPGRDLIFENTRCRICLLRTCRCWREGWEEEGADG